MMLFKRKDISPALAAQRAAQDAPAQDRKSSKQEEKWYFDQVLGFEKSKQEELEKSRSLAWLAASGAGVLALASIVGLACLVYLKVPNPPVLLRMNDTTGQVDLVERITDARTTFGELTDRADLRHYVEARESYDWETIQDMYDTVSAMSSDVERTRYQAQYSSDTAPQKVLKNKFRVIARVGVITFVGKTAQVFFTRTVIPMNAQSTKTTEYWVATIAYEHPDRLPEKGSALELNPTGFKVLSFTLDRDASRAPEPAQVSSSTPASTPTTTITGSQG